MVLVALQQLLLLVIKDLEQVSCLHLVQKEHGLLNKSWKGRVVAGPFEAAVVGVHVEAGTEASTVRHVGELAREFDQALLPQLAEQTALKGSGLVIICVDFQRNNTLGSLEFVVLSVPNFTIVEGLKQHRRARETFVISKNVEVLRQQSIWRRQV